MLHAGIVNDLVMGWIDLDRSSSFTFYLVFYPQHLPPVWSDLRQAVYSQMNHAVYKGAFQKGKCLVLVRGMDFVRPSGPTKIVYLTW